MSIEYSLGNIVVRPSNEITLTTMSPVDEEIEKVGKQLWGNLFKKLSHLDTTVLMGRDKHDKIDHEKIDALRIPSEPILSSSSNVKELTVMSSNKVTSCRNCPHKEDVGIHVKRGDCFELEIVFNRLWSNFDVLTIQLNNADNNDECKLNMNLNKIECGEHEKWKGKIVSKDEKKMKIEIFVPISAMPGAWHLMFTLSSSNSNANVHNFVVPCIQII